MKSINGYPCGSPAFGKWQEMNKAAKILRDEGVIRYYRIVRMGKNSEYYELFVVDIDATKRVDDKIGGKL